MATRRKYWLLAAVFTAVAVVFAAVFLSNDPEFYKGPLGPWGWCISVLINLVGAGVLIWKAPKSAGDH